VAEARLVSGAPSRTGVTARRDRTALDRRVRAVVFALDGVLIESEPIRRCAVNAILGGVEHPALSAFEFDRYRGLEDETLWTRLTADHGLTVSSRWCRRQFDDLVHAAYERSAVVAPGARHLLDALRRCEVRIAIASSSRARRVTCALNALHVDHCFDVVVTGDSVARPKPHPEAYTTTGRRLGVPIDQCLAVEGSRVGCLSASRAGAVVAHLDASAIGDGDDGHAHLCVRGLAELEGWLQFTQRALAVRLDIGW
jgi:HAD superfamily hydrolase (TIGR01509 family)